MKQELIPTQQIKDAIKYLYERGIVFDLAFDGGIRVVQLGRYSYSIINGKTNEHREYVIAGVYQ